MLSKKTIKIFKVIASTTSVLSLGSLSITAISCGNKTPANPPAKKSSWEKFKNFAITETPRRILEATEPVGWESVGDADLSINSIRANNSDHTVSLKIDATSLLQEASFNIKYEDGDVYYYKNWSCASQPDSKGWNTFKALALKVTAPELISQAKYSKATDKLLWKYGLYFQRRWNDNDAAVFDTTQGTIKGSSNPFKGMQGTPKIDENTHSISAIFCKSVADTPDYALDPIKAIITYSKVNQAYDMKDWKFSATQQLQAQDKTALGVTTGLNQVKARQLNKYMTQNWFTLPEDYPLPHGDPVTNAKQEHHTPSDNNLNTLLEGTGWSHVGGEGPYGVTDCSKSVFDKDLIYKGKKIGESTWVRLTVSAVDQDITGPYYINWIMTIMFSYVFANGVDNSAGGNVFSNMWTITYIHNTNV